MSNPTTPSWSAELEPLRQESNRCLSIVLGQVQTKEDLLRVLGQYAAFNGPFGAGVAQLASQVAVHQDLFKDPQESVSVLADRSGEIAKHIFAAAVDEFGGADARYPSHRTLAQYAVKGAGKFLGYEKTSLNAKLAPNETTLQAVEKVKTGYGFGASLDQWELLKSIGFHLGSEYLAGDEFRIIDAFLRERFPDLVASMETVSPEIAAIATSTWIKVHTTVEDEHAAHAVTAANLALEYQEDPEYAKALITRGMQNFAKIQREFLAHMGESNEPKYAEAALDESENAGRQLKKTLEYGKFCVIRIGGKPTVFPFHDGTRHSKIVQGLLEKYKIPNDDFIAAGKFKDREITFDSDSCLELYGREAPQDAGDADALKRAIAALVGIKIE
ncbi:MAG TPA: hypothetical protein VI873_04565 [Candidatus Peribacteraceae bacterium]|nr:hypothetical protein [Candidatus Peribacteraceae bacterium]